MDKKPRGPLITKGRGAIGATERSRSIITLALALIMAAAPATGQIHPATYELGQREAGIIHAWVFLSHKPPILAKSPEVYPVSAKARERRQDRGRVEPEDARQLDRRVSSDFLSQIRGTGAEIRQESRWLNAVSIRATREQLEALERLAFVSRIEPMRQMVRPPPPTAAGYYKGPAITSDSASPLDYGPSYRQLALMNVPEVHDLGYSGRGITVLMLDTGFYKDHEAISPERIIAEYDFVYSDTNTQDQDARDSTTSITQHQHGTSTYTALGGYSPGYLIGPAYRCSYLLAKTELEAVEDTIEEDNYVAGLEWGEALGADIVSSSLGYLDWYTYEDLDGLTAVTTQAVKWATRLGMLVVTSAGNERTNPIWGGYIIAPADADSIITVGAVTASGKLAYFSSHGPTYDGRTKPELVAQGVSVYCASAAGPAQYTYKSGTSMAAPLVAGSAALLLEAHPDWGPEEVLNALMATADRADQPDNDFGWGIPDVLAALNYNEGTPTTPFALNIKQVYPNPFSEGMNSDIAIRWTIENSSEVRLDIYNLLGQHVVNLYSRYSNATGPYSTYWSGIDAGGRRVPSGVYIIRLTSDHDATNKRITILR